MHDQNFHFRSLLHALAHHVDGYPLCATIEMSVNLFVIYIVKKPVLIECVALEFFFLSWHSTM